MSDDLPQPVSGQLAKPGQFAERTAELARQEQPAVRWQRPVNSLRAPRAWLDDAVRAAPGDLDEDAWGLRIGSDMLLDAATGRRRWGPALQGDLRLGKEYRGLVVNTSFDSYVRGTVVLRASDGWSDEIVWQHEPVPYAEFVGGPWSRWLKCEHQDVDLLILHGQDRAWRLALLEPATGQAGWDIAWPDTDPVAGPPAYTYSRCGHLTGSARPDPDQASRVRLAVAPSGRAAEGLAGVDEATGRVLWHIRYPSPGRGWLWKEPAYLGSTGRYLVIVGVVGVGGKFYRVPYDDLGPLPVAPCRCPGNDDDGWASGICQTCGGVRHAYVMVAVHDRLTGRQVWSRRWPDRSAPFTQVADIADLCGNAVVTYEGDFLRGRRVEDGRVLWATVPPPRYKLTSAGRSPASQWVRLRHTEAGRREPNRFMHAETGRHTEADRREPDLFIHVATGRTLTIPGVFHQTRNGLVLTHVQQTLTCLELPGNVVP